MIAEAVLVDTSQAQAQLAQQQQVQHQMQQQLPQQQETAMSVRPMGPPGTGGANGTARKSRRMDSGDGCCDNAQERAKAAVQKVAPCACKFSKAIGSSTPHSFLFCYYLPQNILLRIVAISSDAVLCTLCT